ncbi:hypothetical protein Q4534_08950 [Cyclobacterium sp. 1_MG-2023]|uniref:hypothetical protein n=1 Tax=Cyclobacterium sp. 1_MG-2023 TaxID=3062681 RepID=UPI0026E433F6|nr:hypothetical protein [Cyclobacterium sp. 1_MG-2023]MDO6437532.1 hypothetical protein [Cyclobacterium sp. 1_MG-2023]
MRALVRNYFIFILVVFAACTEGTSGEPEKTAEETATELLAGLEGSQTWTLANGGSVSKDGTTVTNDFEGFELRFIANNTGKSYTTINSNLLFDSNGNWVFSGSNYDKITLSGIQPASNKEISFTKNQEKLRLEFVVPAPQNARVNALAGFYVFDLTLLN